MSDQALQTQSASTANRDAEQAAPEQVANRRSHFYRPSADVVEHPDAFRVLLDMPGAKSDDVDIQVAEGVLHVTARVDSRQEPGKKFLLREYGVADYRRSFQVGDQIDVQHITADYAEGVLSLHLPKLAAAQPRKISVNVG